MRPIPNQLFKCCANLLLGDTTDQENQSVSERFLEDLRYTCSQNAGENNNCRTHRFNLLSNASKMDLFMLNVPDAPNLIFIGGRVLPERFDGYVDYPSSSVSGVSASLAGAFESSVAEGIEYLSQHPSTQDLLMQSDDVIESADKQSWSHYLNVMHGKTPSRFLAARRLISEEYTTLPTSLCLRDQTTTQYKGMSTGCAAGNTSDDATLFALLELVERDSVALWWEGGNSPRPVSNEAITEAGIESLYSLVGRKKNEKTTLVLDITTDVGIPSVVAISTDQDNGARFACGFAARVNLKDAIHKAILEMLQMELGHHVLAFKQQHRGTNALNDQDNEQLNRSRLLKDIWSRPCLKTVGQPRTPSSGIMGTDQSLNYLKKQFESRGLEAYIVNLTRRSLGIPVVKALMPGLQTYPIISNTARLKHNTSTETGISLL